MSMDDISTRPLALEGLLDGITAGRNVLPDFQRDFDWQRGDIISLIATVLSGWPAGSLLIMRGHSEFFSVREFEFAPRRAAQVDYIILDGQQRLTALHNAFRGAGPVTYVLDCKKLTGAPPYTVDNIEEAILTFSATKWAEYSIEKQSVEQMVPLSSLVSASDYFEWRDEVIAATPSESRDARASMLTRIYKSLLGNANKYFFPAVMLESDLPPEAVARIFERVNRTGQRLGTFDLLVARTYTNGWNLRERWETARRESDYLDLFLGEDGTPVLQAIALKYVKDVRQPAMLDLSKPLIQENWDQAVSEFDAVFHLIVEKIGISTPTWLPYKTILLPMVALSLDHDLSNLNLDWEGWFWARSFGQDYESGSSTRAVTDYNELLSLVESPGSRVLSTSILEMDDLFAATRQQNGGLWRCMMALIVSSEPADLLTGADLTQDPKAVAASVLPRADDGLHLRVLGQILASRRTAGAARTGRLLEDYIEGRVDTPDAWSKQLIPLDANLSMTRDEFLRERATLVQDQLAQRSRGLLRIRSMTPSGLVV